MSLRKAAEMALDALRYTTDHLPAKTGVEREVDDAITALQVALAQPKWVGLTDEEIVAEIPITTRRPVTTFARAIEAILKEKNT